jgi:hypothetical protein
VSDPPIRFRPTLIYGCRSLVGYKFRFLGDDAKIASKELGIAW